MKFAAHLVAVLLAVVTLWSMRHELTKVRISGPEPLVRAAELAGDDLRKTGRITGKLKFTVDESATELRVDAELAPVASED